MKSAGKPETSQVSENGIVAARGEALTSKNTSGAHRK